jgi:hypothetical protein
MEVHMEQPSKYHKLSYVGKGLDGANENGYRYSWESDHPELEPTSTFALSYTQHYCSYCCSEAYPIQAGLRSDLYGHVDFNKRNFDVTGYTCICEGAEKEKELRYKLNELKKKHEQEEYELKKEYKPFLKVDKKRRLELQYKNDLKNLEWNEDSFSFDKR